MGTQNDLVNFATTGLQEAVRWSTVGIVGGSDEHKWTGIGAGSLIRLQGHYLILTAEHVIASTRHEDLRFFFPFRTPPGTAERETIRGLVGAPESALQTFEQIELGRIARDTDIDLAAIAVDPKLEESYPARFFDIKSGGQTPAEGTDILATGYPRDLARQTIPGEVVVFSHTELTEVLLTRDGLMNFDPSVHFLAAYHSATEYAGANPTGLSGSGAWFHRPSPAPGLWHPNIDLAGLTVSWYPPQRLLKLLRRETIESFLGAHWT